MSDISMVSTKGVYVRFYDDHYPPTGDVAHMDYSRTIEAESRSESDDEQDD